MTDWPMLLFIMFLVFFKQKTAYEMRISDWSSDVCSSDLLEPRDMGEDAFGRLRMRLPAEDAAAERRAHRDRRGELARRTIAQQLGRASCRERVCLYV